MVFYYFLDHDCQQHAAAQLAETVETCHNPISKALLAVLASVPRILEDEYRESEHEVTC